jgi:hypothetical protein
MSTIHLVIECVSYEGCRTIKAFRAQGDAERFAEQCRQHHTKKPTFPSNYEDDGVYAAYEAELAAWRGAHPHLNAESADYFGVEAIELL